MAIAPLKDEIANDPAGLGYAGKTPQEIADLLNIKNVDRDKTSLAGTEILEACEESALLALSGEKATRVWGILGLPNVDPFGIAEKIFIDAFGRSSVTITNLAALRVEQISRAESVGGIAIPVKAGHVEAAL